MDNNSDLKRLRRKSSPGPHIGYSHEGGRYLLKFDDQGNEIPWSKAVYGQNDDFLVFPQKLQFEKKPSEKK